MLNSALQLTTTSVHLNFNLCMFHTCGQSLESCLTLCGPMGRSLPGSSVHGIFQLRILEWIVMTSSRRSYWPRDWTRASSISCITGGFSPVCLAQGYHCPLPAISVYVLWSVMCLWSEAKWSESCSVVSDSLWPMDCIVHGILQARILVQVAFPFSRGSSQPRDRTQVSRIAGRFYTRWATRVAQEYCSG